MCWYICGYLAHPYKALKVTGVDLSETVPETT